MREVSEKTKQLIREGKIMNIPNIYNTNRKDRLDKAIESTKQVLKKLANIKQWRKE